MAAWLSYFTISRYGDIMLRPVAYEKKWSDVAVGNRTSDDVNYESKLERYRKCGYSSWWWWAFASTIVMILGFPVIATGFLWIREKIPWRAIGRGLGDRVLLITFQLPIRRAKS